MVTVELQLRPVICNILEEKSREKIVMKTFNLLRADIFTFILVVMSLSAGVVSIVEAARTVCSPTDVY